MKRKFNIYLSILLALTILVLSVNIDSELNVKAQETTPIEISESPTPTEEIEPTGEVEITPTDDIEITPTEETIEATTPTPTDLEADDQTETTIENANNIIVTEVITKTQYPWNKKIPIVLHVTPQKSGEKLQIRWQNMLGIKTNVSLVTINNPVEGKTYSKSFLLEPIAAGRQRIVADIILTTYNSNYVTSQDIPFYFTTDLAVYPKSSQYIAYTIAMWVGIIGVFFMLLPFGAYKGLIYAKDNLFPRWMEKKVQVPS